MSSIRLDNWMSQVYGQIKDTPVCQLPIPGSHDAISYPDIDARSQTQSKDITNQLMAGYRYFDFRVKVKDGVYYGVHGTDNTEHDYTGVAGKGHQPYVLDEIAAFLRAADHDKELVILTFSHFTAHAGQTFGHGDKLNFVALLKQHLSGLLVPRYRNSSHSNQTATFAECLAQGQVIAIIDDDAEWYAQPAGTLLHEVEAKRSLFWSYGTCVEDNYSGVYYDANVGAPLGDLTARIHETLADQEARLRNRSLSKFCITQAILNYAAVPVDGKSQNHLGAREMNPRFAKLYEHAWRRGKDSNSNPGMPTPNILLLDFVGEFDTFPEACVRMVSQQPAAQALVSGKAYRLRSNTYQNYLTTPAAYGGYSYAYTDPQSAHPHTFVKKGAGIGFKSGDELYLLSVIGGKKAYLRTSSAASNDLWYEGGDHPTSVHTWRIEKVVAGPDDVIRVGDHVRLVSVDESAYMDPRGGVDYVSLTSEARSWAVEA